MSSWARSPGGTRRTLSRMSRAAASPSPHRTSSRWTSGARPSRPRWASGWLPGSST